MNDNNKNSFSLLKGIAILVIIFAHIKVNNLVINIISSFGYVAVNIFFAISGSLLIEKFIHIKNYEKKFIVKKLQRIYIPYIISNLFYIVIITMFKEYDFNILKLIKDIFGINIINEVNWYIHDLLLMYIIFYSLYRIVNFKLNFNNKYVKYLLLSICSYILLIILKINNEYLTFITCNSLSFSFYLGMLLRNFKLKKNRLFKSLIIKYLLIILTLILHLIINQTIINTEFQFILYELMIPICISILTQYKFDISFVKIKKALEKIGNYSLEIYLLHIPIMILYRNDYIYIRNDLLYIILYISTLVISVYILKKISNKIIAFVLKLNKWMSKVH